MKIKRWKAGLYAALAQVATAGVAGPPTDAAAAQAIVRAGDQASAAGPAEFFTGRVRVDPVWAAGEDINASRALVTFEPGARSAWQTHPKGQRLMVIAGIGLTQEGASPCR